MALEAVGESFERCLAELMRSTPTSVGRLVAVSYDDDDDCGGVGGGAGDDGGGQ